MVTYNCNSVPSIQSLYQKEQSINRKSSRLTISQLKKLITKEQKITFQLDYTIRHELKCDSINWGFSRKYNWRSIQSSSS